VVCKVSAIVEKKVLESEMCLYEAKEAMQYQRLSNCEQQPIDNHSTMQSTKAIIKR